MANSVTIVIDGDTVKAVSAINQVETQLDKMDKKAKKTSESSSGSFAIIDQALSKMGISLGALTVGFAVGAVVTGLGAMMKGAIDTADNLAKLSQRTGMSVESLSTMSYALSLNDMSLEGFTTSVKKLSDSMFGLSEDGETAKNTLVRLGVDATDQSGNLRKVDDVMLDVADRFKAMPDGAQKAALAVELFGKSGMDMIPFLNNGSEGIKQLQDEAKKLGLEIDTTTAKMSEQFNDQLETLQKQAGSLGMVMASELLPGLVGATGGLIDFMKESQAATIIGTALGVSVKVLTQIFIYFATGLSSVYFFLAGISGEIDNIINLRFDKLGSSISSNFSKIQSSAVTAQKTIDALWGGSSSTSLKKTLDDLTPSFDDLYSSMSDRYSKTPGLEAKINKIKDDYQKLYDAAKTDEERDKATQFYNQQIASLQNLGRTAKKTGETFGEYWTKLEGKYTVLSETQKKMKELGDEFERLYNLAKNPDQIAMALEFYNKQVDAIREKTKISSKDLISTFSDQQSYFDQIKTTPIAPVEIDTQPITDYGLTWMLTNEEMANGAVTTFGVMSQAALEYYQQGGERSKSMLALYKATAITQTAITTVQAAMSALQPPPIGLGPIFGIPLMGATIALGIANISRIASMQVGSGLSGGGAVTVPSIPRENNTTNNTNNTRNQAVTINVFGNIVDQDQFAREMIPAIQKAYGDGV